MLERATACLTSGAARETTRCIQKASRSKRMLHSTFWNHGAGDLELPPWAVSMLPTPPDLPLKSYDSGSVHEEKAKGQEQPLQHTGRGPTDGIFLDFLYPQQALAVLHKRSTQQWQKWERRNATRLPDGFVVASRGYASRAIKKRNAREQAKAERKQRARKDDEFEESPIHDTDSGEQEPAESQTARSGSAAARPDPFELTNFADSPMDLPEKPNDAVRKLRSIMSYSKRKHAGTAMADEVVDRAWTLYEELDDAGQDDVRLKTELLSWLLAQQTEKSDTHCAELYHSMPLGQRNLQVYETALALFLRRNQQLSASKLHREALRNLENGQKITRTLFRHAVDNELWRLAIRTEGRHKEVLGSSSQMKLFWLHVSETPQLLSRAIKLALYLRPVGRKGRMDTHTRDFCVRFYTEAITQEFLQADAALYSLPAVSKQNPPRDRIRTLFRSLFKTDNHSSKLFEETLLSLLSPNARIPYVRMHNLVSSIFGIYRAMSNGKYRPRRSITPSEQLLMVLLQRVTEYADGISRDESTPNSLTVEGVVRAWKHYRGGMSAEAHTRLVTYYARAGSLEAFEAAAQDFKNEYPVHKHRKDALWTSIYMYARKADLDGAQQAFAAVKRELAEHGDTPNLKCWNTLLHAHSRADDLEGGLTNLQNLIDYAKLTPDGHSFHPLTEMFAKRGDVDGVEDLLEQYDSLTQSPRSTALLGSLITAFVKSNDVQGGEKVLWHTLDKTIGGEITGSLTKCFNIMLTAHAANRDLDATSRVYREMRKIGIRLDTDTYAALIFALTVHRQTAAAYKIVTHEMKASGVQPTAFHYGIVMGGYLNYRYVDDALRVHADMTRSKIRPTLSTRTLYQQAITQKHLAEHHLPFGHDADMESINETMAELQRLARDADGDKDGIAAKTPQLGLRSSSLVDASLSAQFDFMIIAYGKARLMGAVQQLFTQYQEAAKERSLEDDAPPIRLLTALMGAYWRAGEHEEVDKCWKLAKQRADDTSPTVAVPMLSKSEGSQRRKSTRALDALELAPTSDEAIDRASAEGTSVDPPSQSDSSEGRQALLTEKESRQPQPAPGRRHILTRPLRYYLASLYARDQLYDVITTVSSLLTQGYVLDNRTFNYFIETLCRASPPLALLAFTLTERFLMPNFPGWTEQRRRFADRPQDRAEGLQHIRARYLKPGLLMPQYRVMVRLGSILLDVRRMEAMGRRSRSNKGSQERDLERYVGTMREIRERAPKTLFAVQSMPKIKDRLQDRLLRREG